MKIRNPILKSLVELSRLIYRIIIRLGRILIIRWIINIIIFIFTGEF